MDRRTKICIWIILIGLGNFLAYSLIYMFIGGEAVSGVIRDDGRGGHEYFLKGPSQEDIPVSKGVYVYSGIHSISIWITVGAVMLAMLILAKERIASSMRSTIVRGRTLITILATASRERSRSGLGSAAPCAKQSVQASSAALRRLSGVQAVCAKSGTEAPGQASAKANSSCAPIPLRPREASASGTPGEDDSD
jgi:hypothetical protein